MITEKISIKAQKYIWSGRIINELEDRSKDITKYQEHKENTTMKTKHSLRETLDIIKYTNASILRVLEKDMSKSKMEEKFNEMIAENFPNLMKHIYLHIQEARETLSRINSRRFVVETSQYK